MTYLVGSFVSERISRSSSLDKKKNLGKYNLFFSKYSFKPYKRETQNNNFKYFVKQTMKILITNIFICVLYYTILANYHTYFMIKALSSINKVKYTLKL